jgi:hypothetical protein
MVIKEEVGLAGILRLFPALSSAFNRSVHRNSPATQAISP